MATRTWKLKENIKADADGEIITTLLTSTAKKVSQDYERT